LARPKRFELLTPRQLDSLTIALPVTIQWRRLLGLYCADLVCVLPVCGSTPMDFGGAMVAPPELVASTQLLQCVTF
jgi:hypothetical protein